SDSRQSVGSRHSGSDALRRLQYARDPVGMVAVIAREAPLRPEWSKCAETKNHEEHNQKSNHSPPPAAKSVHLPTARNRARVHLPSIHAPVNPVAEITKTGLILEVMKAPSRSYSLPCIVRSSYSLLFSQRSGASGVVIEPTEDEIRELCARVAAADSSDLPEVVVDCRAPLKPHAAQIRLIGLKPIKAFPPSSPQRRMEGRSIEHPR